jgi:hypothetical protein
VFYSLSAAARTRGWAASARATMCGFSTTHQMVRLSAPSDVSVTLLWRTDIRSVMLRHEDDFDFPFELCYLDDPSDPFLSATALPSAAGILALPVRRTL